jgi:hypothetical protein
MIVGCVASFWKERSKGLLMHFSKSSFRNGHREDRTSLRFLRVSPFSKEGAKEIPGSVHGLLSRSQHRICRIGIDEHFWRSAPLLATRSVDRFHVFTELSCLRSSSLLTSFIFPIYLFLFRFSLLNLPSAWKICLSPGQEMWFHDEHSIRSIYTVYDRIFPSIK